MVFCRSHFEMIFTKKQFSTKSMKNFFSLSLSALDWNLNALYTSK
jgi:hypothetical protein